MSLSAFFPPWVEVLFFIYFVFEFGTFMPFATFYFFTFTSLSLAPLFSVVFYFPVIDMLLSFDSTPSSIDGKVFKSASCSEGLEINVSCFSAISDKPLSSEDVTEEQHECGYGDSYCWLDLLFLILFFWLLLRFVVFLLLFFEWLHFFYTGSFGCSGFTIGGFPILFLIRSIKELVAL